VDINLKQHLISYDLPWADKMEHNMEEKTINDQITDAYNSYIEENTRFVSKGVKASAARARKALGELRKLAGERRKQIQTEKEALASK
jgi:hypothetical protein